MTCWTIDALDMLAAVMVPVAADLTCRVRDHDAVGVEQAIGGMSVLHLRALAVVLAAMVPDDQPLDDLIAWTRCPRGPEPITPERAAANRAELLKAITNR